MSSELRVSIEIGDTDGSTNLRAARVTSLFNAPGENITEADCDMWQAQVDRVVEEVRLDLTGTLATFRRRMGEDSA